MTETLLLTNGYSPIKVISWKRAITLLFKGKVEIVEEYEKEVRSTSVVIKVPSVVRLLNMFKRVYKPVRFSKLNIYARDNFKCSYCQRGLTMATATLDHVVPKQQKGTTCWENVVLSCSQCNLKKANRTPEEAGMRLYNVPYKPKTVPVLAFMLSKKKVPKEWKNWVKK